MAKIIISIILLIPIFSKAQSLPEKDVLDEMKAIEVVWGEYYGDEMVLAKMKSTKKWGLYTVFTGIDIEDFSFEEFIPPKFDSLSFFEPEAKFQIVKQKGKYGILLPPYEMQDAADRVSCKFDIVIHKHVNEEDYVLIKEGGKWGLIDWIDGFYIVDPMFDTPDEVPLIRMERWMVATFKIAKKRLNADLVILDPNNGDGTLKARNKKTKKWGMYQFFDKAQAELIPMAYDSLNFIPYNGSFTAVYNDGKVGFYLSAWSYEDAKQTVPCLYDNYQRFNVKNRFYLAVQRDGKWGWVDWLTGEEKSAFISSTKEELTTPNFEQGY